MFPERYYEKGILARVLRAISAENKISIERDREFLPKGKHTSELSLCGMLIIRETFIFFFLLS